MKCNYFGYYLKDQKGNKVWFDLTPFLDSFLDYASLKVKSSIVYNDEYLYLMRHFDNVYFFVMTKSQEVAKAINTNDLSLSQIRTLLDDSQQLGFASYLIFNEYYFGFASTLYAPKINALGYFIDSLLKASGHGDWEFITRPMMREMTRAEAMELPHIGLTTIEVFKSHSLGGLFKGFMGGDISEYDDISSFEITIKPRPKQNIKEEVKRFLEHVEDENVKKIMLKARDEAASQATEVYLTGAGAIYDPIKKGTEAEIAAQLSHNIKNNRHLTQKLEEFKKDEAISKDPIDSLGLFCSSSSWSNLDGGLS